MTEQRAADESAGVGTPPPLIYVAGFGAGLLLQGLLPDARFSGPVRVAAGAVVMSFGLALLGWWLFSFRRASTPTPPWEPTTALVTDGPYRLSRNPGYLSFALIYVAVAFFANAPWALLPLPLVLVVVDRAVVVPEERYLERRFGERYERFKERTRRWV